MAERILDCPKCPGKMSKVTLGGVEVDRCELCRGIWFDADEFARLREIADSHTIDDGSPIIGSLKDARRNAGCPICKVPMVSFDAPDIKRGFKLERCPRCKGMFFDAGEYRDFVLDQSFWDSIA